MICSLHCGPGKQRFDHSTNGGSHRFQTSAALSPLQYEPNTSHEHDINPVALSPSPSYKIATLPTKENLSWHRST
jgi:hypothetical protein